MKYQKAFTLAEVLITLGIIGVVAAMTMPTLLNNIDNKVYETQNKKAQAVLSNGIKMLMANEDITSVENSRLASCTTSECVSKELHNAFKIVSDSNNNNLNVPSEYKFTNGTFPIWTDDNMYYSFTTSDGMLFGIKKFSPGASSFTFVADLNGNKNPNTGAKDLCKYTISSTGTLIDSCSSMAACGGTANSSLKYYSWGMQSANAAPEIGDSSGNCGIYGNGAFTNGTGCNHVGGKDYELKPGASYGECCVPIEEKKPTSCF